MLRRIGGVRACMCASMHERTRVCMTWVHREMHRGEEEWSSTGMSGIILQFIKEMWHVKGGDRENSRDGSKGAGTGTAGALHT